MDDRISAWASARLQRDQEGLHALRGQPGCQVLHLDQIAPRLQALATKRPTFAALNTVPILPLAALPLLAGLLLQAWSYPALFALTAGFADLGAAWTRKL